MKVAVDQPNYIPWKGYFELIHDVDLFVFYSDVQYTTRDWRNRNRIPTKDGLLWLTVPVGHDTQRLICDVEIPDSSWQKTHFEILRHTYARSPFFNKYRPFLEHVYLKRTWSSLLELDRYLTEQISREFLGIKTQFADSRDYITSGTKHKRLLNLLSSIGATSYESGPAAKDYILPSDYVAQGIALSWKSYDGYPVYPQSGGFFSHFVSILDLLFQMGDEAPYYIWGWREKAGTPSWIPQELTATYHSAPSAAMTPSRP